MLTLEPIPVAFEKYIVIVPWSPTETFAGISISATSKIVEYGTEARLIGPLLTLTPLTTVGLSVTFCPDIKLVTHLTQKKNEI